MKDNVGL